MKYPTLNVLPTSRDMIGVFGGYNHNLLIGDGEFYNMTNLSSTDYPILSTRKRRGTYAKPASPQGLIAKDSLCYVDGSDFVINDYHVPMGLSVDAEMCPKTLISMGAYVIIMPDKMYINTARNDDEDAFEFGKIEASVTTTGTVTFELCKVDGTGFGETMPSPSAPTITEEMENDPSLIPMWLDTSSTPNTLRQYSSYQGEWVTVPTTYIKISAPDSEKIPFAEGDGVTISGVISTDLSDLNASHVVWAKGDDYIVVKGILNAVVSQEEPVTIARRMPDMDFIVESQNRLWGCKYGINKDGKMVNEIYASKLGDFKNWNYYPGTSTDSYFVTVGTDGQFTGAINHLGYPIFFKENCMHKVYGNYPAQYQVQTTTCRGVQKGCSKSLSIVNEVLYYKSRSAVCAYDGSLPAEISTALGDISYHDAVAGTLGNKYYISMADGNEEHHIFVYDTARGMWHREDNTHATDFCTCRGDLLFIDGKDLTIKSVNGDGEAESNAVKWVAESGVWGTDHPDKKYISRIDVRLKLNVGTRVIFRIEYDSSGEWEHLFTMMGTSLKTFSIPVKPKRCDHLRLRIEGEGEAKIYSITRTFEQGSGI